MSSKVMSPIHDVILISSPSIFSSRLLFYLTRIIGHFTQLFQFTVSLGPCVLFSVLQSVVEFYIWLTVHHVMILGE